MAKKKEEFPGQFAAELLITEKSKLIRQQMELIEKTITEIIDACFSITCSLNDTQYLLKTMSKAILASINSNSNDIKYKT